MNALIPNFLRQLSSDEYTPQPYTVGDQRVISRLTETLGDLGSRYRIRGERWLPRSGTVAGLATLNKEYGERFFEVTDTAVMDSDEAAALLNSDSPVVDVQTHFIGPRCAATSILPELVDMYRTLMPSWWTEMDDVVKYDLAEYVRNVYLESEVAVAILTSGPGIDDTRMLYNDEMAAARALFDAFAGSGRLLSHAVVHADIPEEIIAMSEWHERYRPAAWKVYTMGRRIDGTLACGWMLDDEVHGVPFLERVRKLGPKRICVHKGIAALTDNGSPRDIGPAAKAFPDIQFLVYHSGFEFQTSDADEEGPYTPATVGQGVNRLIHSCQQHGIGHGSNVFPELGTTWFSVIRRPRAAAHVLGKLIKQFGEDNVIWGSDSIWYGSQQPLIDAFRAFQIPDSMCEQFGYAKLTKAVKDKILGRNAARVYGLDLGAIKSKVAQDDLQWSKLLLDDFKKNGAGLR